MCQTLRSLRRILSLLKICYITPLAGLTVLHKVGWALGHESADLHLLVIEHDQNYTFSVVSILFHKTWGGEGGALIRGEALILKFSRLEGSLFRGGAYLREVLIREVTVLHVDFTLFLFSFSNPGVSVSGGKTTETPMLYGFTCNEKKE